MKHLGRALHTIQDKWAHAENTPPGGWGQHLLGLVGLAPDPDDPFAHPSEFARAQQESRDLVEKFAQDIKRARPEKFRAIDCK